MGTRPLTIGDFSRAVARALSDHADAAGVSQSAIARETGISQTRVNLIMRGERAITVEETALICEALGTPMLTVIREAEQSLEDRAGNVLPFPSAPTPPHRVFEEYEPYVELPDDIAAKTGDADTVRGLDPDAGEESQLQPDDWDDPA